MVNTSGAECKAVCTVIRYIRPLDRDAIIASAKKIGWVVSVDTVSGCSDGESKRSGYPNIVRKRVEECGAANNTPSKPKVVV